MKIYLILWHTGEKSWVCANTVVEALRIYCINSNTEFKEFDSMDDIIVVPRFQWRFFKTNNLTSFHNYMRTAILPTVIKESFINFTFIELPTMPQLVF